MTALPETQRKRRGHAFYPTKAAKVPALYSGEDIELEDKVIRAHYFVGGSDWWITEMDPEDGMAFGFCAPQGVERGEWGNVYLPELEAVKVQGWLVVERDMWWKPITFAELMAVRT